MRYNSGMTPEEIERGLEAHERRLTRVEENLVVQGEILNRVDQRLDRLAGLVETQSESMLLMQSALKSLFERMDAFIRGLERRDGHPPAQGA